MMNGCFTTYNLVMATTKSGYEWAATIRSIVEHQMRCDDETTATQLHERLIQHGISPSLRIVLCSWELLGWTYRGSAYCQLIRDVNKQTRLEWALQHQNDNFQNVILSDEASIQIETHRLRCYRKKGEQPKRKPRPNNVGYSTVTARALIGVTIPQVVVILHPKKSLTVAADSRGAKNRKSNNNIMRFI